MTVKRVISGSDFGGSGRDRRTPLLERRVGAEKAQAVHLDHDLGAGLGGKRRGELGADGGSANDPVAVFVNGQGILRESLGGCLGVAGIERLGVLLDQGGDGLFVVRSRLRRGRRGAIFSPWSFLSSQDGVGREQQYRETS